MRILYLWLIAGSLGCMDTPADQQIQNKSNQSKEVISIPAISLVWGDTALKTVNGVLFYQEKPFSGFVNGYYANGIKKSLQSFYAGKEEGWLVTYYPNKKIDAKRYYHKGEKDSIHQGWWQNGKLRFEYHFKDGVYEGDFKEWYQSGKRLKWISYQAGKEVWGKGWRENGKAFMSFVVRDGRLYGQINPNLCYSLKKENGEFAQ